MSTNLWRNRHDRSKIDQSLDTVKFAVSEGIVGVGWEVETESGKSLNWKEYKHRAEEADYTDVDAWVRSLSAIHEHMDEGDLCYIRDFSGQFYLGRVIGPWRYETKPEYKQHGLVNVRDCKWHRIENPEETVPTELLESFGRGSVLQRIKDPRLVAFSQRLYEVMDSDEVTYDIDLPYTLDNWLSDDDLKDLLALKLQIDQDQILLPSTVDQKPFLPDGITVNRFSANRIPYQVQHQHDDLPPGAYKVDGRQVVYLQRADDRRPNLPDNVKIIPLTRLKSIFEDHWDFLPRRLQIIGNVLQENGALGATGTIPSLSEREKESSRKPAGVMARSVMYLIAGFLLGLSLMYSYGHWASPAKTTFSQQQHAALQSELNSSKERERALASERNELKKDLAALKLAQANQSNERTTPTMNSNWTNIEVRQFDTLSELLERFQGTQLQQDEVVERNNIQDRDLIYPGDVLSFPTRTTSEIDQFATQ